MAGNWDHVKPRLWKLDHSLTVDFPPATTYSPELCYFVGRCVPHGTVGYLGEKHDSGIDRRDSVTRKFLIAGEKYTRRYGRGKVNFLSSANIKSTRRRGLKKKKRGRERRKLRRSVAVNLANFWTETYVDEISHYGEDWVFAYDTFGNSILSRATRIYFKFFHAFDCIWNTRQVFGTDPLRNQAILVCPKVYEVTNYQLMACNSQDFFENYCGSRGLSSFLSLKKRGEKM